MPPSVTCRRSCGSASGRLLALIVFGIVLIFVHILHGDLIYSVIGLVIFAGFTMFDFQRLRRSSDIASAPLLAASIFLDLINVFLFFLTIFSGGEERYLGAPARTTWPGFPAGPCDEIVAREWHRSGPLAVARDG